MSALFGNGLISGIETTVALNLTVVDWPTGMLFNGIELFGFDVGRFTPSTYTEPATKRAP